MIIPNLSAPQAIRSGCPLELKKDAPETAAPAYPRNDTSPMTSGSHWTVQRVEKERNLRLAELAQQMNGAQKIEFEKLRKCVREFADARAFMETHMADYTGAVKSIAAQEEVKNTFLSDLGQFEQGRLPAYTRLQCTAFDRRLELACMSVWHAMGQRSAHQTMSMKDVLEAQRLWLAYRDAWAAFGHARYPSVAAHSWKALLTARRIEQLRGLRRDLGAPGIVQV